MECNEKLRTCMDQMEQHRTQLRNVQLEQYQCTTKYDVCLSIYNSVCISRNLSIYLQICLSIQLSMNLSISLKVISHNFVKHLVLISGMEIVGQGAVQSKP